MDELWQHLLTWAQDMDQQGNINSWGEIEGEKTIGVETDQGDFFIELKEA